MKKPAIVPAIVLIAAVAENGVIGQGRALPWRIPSEMRHFRTRTLGHPVVAGRRTYESFARKPLPGRTNIVVSRDRALALAGAVVASGLADALAVARGDALRRGVDEIMVVGGAEIYAQALPLADRLVITRVRLQPQGDAWFPTLDLAVWEDIAHADHAAGPQDDAGFAIHVYERRSQASRPGGWERPNAWR
jgi:dihydrofolate reductase